MADEFQSEDGRVILTEAGEAILLETATTDVLDFVTPFFTNNPFAVYAIFAHAGADQKLVTVIFNNPSRKAMPAGVQISSEAPSCLCMDSEFTDVQENDIVIISSVTYYISEIIPDGTGITELILSLDPIQ